MGIIDQTVATVSCAACKISETAKATQKGSSYNIGSWSDFSEFSKFDAKTTRGADGPEVVSATCKACGGVARVTHSYA